MTRGTSCQAQPPARGHVSPAGCRGSRSYGRGAPHTAAAAALSPFPSLGLRLRLQETEDSWAGSGLSACRTGGRGSLHTPEGRGHEGAVAQASGREERMERPSSEQCPPRVNVTGRGEGGRTEGSWCPPLQGPPRGFPERSGGSGGVGWVSTYGPQARPWHPGPAPSLAPAAPGDPRPSLCSPLLLHRPWAPLSS